MTFREDSAATITKSKVANNRDQNSSGPIAEHARADGKTGSSRAGYVRFLVLVGIVYVAIYGWLLVSTGGLPYVMDNNESFSSLVHASNLAHFGLAGSFGLTDEAYGPDPAAHPYVHTHQGNFPRLFAFVLYVLGAKTIQAQIVVTTFTVGTLGIFLVYYFFSRLASPLFALVISLLFMSDYVLFAQWQVVTYRVWHVVFMFAALICVDGFSERRRRLWAGLTIATFACLFYFEFIFVSFVGLTAGLYAVYRYRTQLGVLFRAWFSMGVGALAGLSVLVGQLLAYLGWDGLQHDIFLTYFARNDAGDSNALVNELHSFYSSHNIVFWYNLVDATGLRSPMALLRLLFRFAFQVYTPLLTLIALVVIFGWVLASLTQAVEWRLGVRSRSTDAAGHRSSIGYAVATCVFGLTAYLLCVEILGSQTFSGIAPSLPGLHLSSDASSTVIAIVLAALLVGLTWQLRHVERHAISSGRLLVAAAFAATVVWFLQQQSGLYNQDWAVLWRNQLEAMVPSGLARALVLCSVALGGSLIIGGPTRLLSSDFRRSLGGVSVYLTCTVIALVGTYLLSPGYVYSGYLVRSAPLAVFLTDVLLAFAALVILAIAARALSCVLRRAPPRRTDWAALARSGPPRTAVVMGGAGLVISVAVLMVTGVYWLSIQKAYVALLPPDHFAFLKRLAEPPFAGQSMVVGNYAAPVAVQTGQWAYFDGKIQNGPVTLSDQGYVVGRDMDTYLWLADKRTNAAYAKPAYFVCMVDQDLSTVVDQLANPKPQGFCQEQGTPGRLSTGSDWAPRNELVARDSTPWDWWEIIKLDWDYPPFLASQPGSDDRVHTEVVPGQTGYTVQASYTARQQDGVPMLAPIVRLYRSDDQPCVLAETTDSSGFNLPAQFAGQIRLSVTPRTATQTGTEYFGSSEYVAWIRFTIPVTTGSASQEVWASTLAQAHQKGQSTGTWMPAASEGMTPFTLPDIQTGTFQVVEAKSLEQAEQLADARGTWVPQAGTFGQFTNNPEATVTNWAGYSCK